MGAKVNAMGCRMGVPTVFMLDWPAMLTAAKLDWLSRMGWDTAPAHCMVLAADMWAGDMPAAAMLP